MSQILNRGIRFRLLVLGGILLLGASGCKHLNSVVDAPPVYLPEMHVLNVVSDRIDVDTLPGGTGQITDFVTVTITVTVAASDSTGITGVAGSVYSPDWVLTNQPSTVLTNFSLTQTGVDSVFTGQATFQIYRFEVGTYIVRLQAFNGQGLGTIPINYFVQLTNSKNRPPVIDSVTLTPNPIRLGTGGTLEAKVSDPDGQFDVLSVSASLVKPDGTPWQTVSMFDDGLSSHNDRAKADSIYSSALQFNSTGTLPAIAGKYLCRIIATDKSGATARDSFTLTVQ